MLSGLLLEDAILYNATKKVDNPPDQVFFTGLLAGFWVGIGGLAAVSAAGGVPEEVRHSWLSLPKFLMGSFFAFGETVRKTGDLLLTEQPCTSYRSSEATSSPETLWCWQSVSLRHQSFPPTDML